MEPSAKTPNVLLFTERSAGDRFGYKFGMAMAISASGVWKP